MTSGTVHAAFAPQMSGISDELAWFPFIFRAWKRLRIVTQWPSRIQYLRVRMQQGINAVIVQERQTCG